MPASALSASAASAAAPVQVFAFDDRLGKREAKGSLRLGTRRVPDFRVDVISTRGLGSWWNTPCRRMRSEACTLGEVPDTFSGFPSIQHRCSRSPYGEGEELSKVLAFFPHSTPTEAGPGTCLLSHLCPPLSAFPAILSPHFAMFSLLSSRAGRYCLPLHRHAF